MFLILSPFTPIWLETFYFIIESFSKYFIEKYYKTTNKEFEIVNPRTVSSLSQIDNCLFTLPTLLKQTNTKIKGIIIGEKYYGIKEKKIHLIKILETPKISSPKLGKDFRLNVQKVNENSENSESIKKKKTLKKHFLFR